MFKYYMLQSSTKQYPAYEHFLKSLNSTILLPAVGGTFFTVASTRVTPPSVGIIFTSIVASAMSTLLT